MASFDITRAPVDWMIVTLNVQIMKEASTTNAQVFIFDETSETVSYLYPKG